MKVTVMITEVVIVENIRLVRLLDLTADFGVKTNAKLTPICQLHGKSNWYQLSVHRNSDANFLRKFPDVYSLTHNFSEHFYLAALPLNSG